MGQESEALVGALNLSSRLEGRLPGSFGGQSEMDGYSDILGHRHRDASRMLLPRCWNKEFTSCLASAWRVLKEKVIGVQVCV